MRAIIEKILADDLSRSGEAVPKWMTDVVLPSLNNALETIGRALQGNLSFADNAYGTEVSLSLTHGVAQNYSIPGKRQVKGIAVVDASGKYVDSFGFTRNSDASISITVNFTAGAGTIATCLIQIQYR